MADTETTPLEDFFSQPITEAPEKPRKKRRKFRKYPRPPELTLDQKCELLKVQGGAVIHLPGAVDSRRGGPRPLL
jgi:hypothetical protein